MSWSAIIFDCDGVLIDSEALACRAVAEELARHGANLEPNEVARRYAGYTDSDLAAAVSKETGCAIPADFPAAVAARALALFEKELKPMPGAVDLLGQIEVRTAVASNSGRRRLLRSLEIAGLIGFFAPERIFSAEQVARPKPAPDLYRHAAEALGAAPGDCLVIEDSETGITAARAAGMTVIGFTGASHAGADHAARLKAAGAAEIAADFMDLYKMLGIATA